MRLGDEETIIVLSDKNCSYSSHFLAVVCTSFVLFYDFDDTDDGSKSAPPSQSSSSSGRKLGPVNGNEKGDGNVFGHSLVKGEDEVVEKIKFWPERFGKKKRVNWRRLTGIYV